MYFLSLITSGRDKELMLEATCCHVDFLLNNFVFPCTNLDWKPLILVTCICKLTINF